MNINLLPGQARSDANAGDTPNPVVMSTTSFLSDDSITSSATESGSTLLRRMENSKVFEWPEEVKHHGYMYKETKGDLRLMAAARWRKRYFVLWVPQAPYDKFNSLLMYFEDEVACQRFLSTSSIRNVILQHAGPVMQRSQSSDHDLTSSSSKPAVVPTTVKKVTTLLSPSSSIEEEGEMDDDDDDDNDGGDDFMPGEAELLLGSINLASLAFFQESYRLDLQHRAMELITEERSWVLQVEGLGEFYAWFNEIWRALVLCNNRSVKMNLPNVWNYHMPGKIRYRVCFAIFLGCGVWWLYNLFAAGNPSYQPCVEDLTFLRKNFDCADIASYGQSIGYAYDLDHCHSVSGVKPWWSPFHRRWRCVVDVNEAYYGTWRIAFYVFLAAEALNLLLSTISYLSMWKPTRRGTRSLDNLNPLLPKSEWPVVDVMISHFTEPAEDTLQTLEAALALDYPKQKLHIWICDDGYCESTFEGSSKYPSAVAVNKALISQTGDVREQLAQLIREKVLSPTDISATDARAWRQTHSQVKGPPTAENPRPCVDRTDCAVGFVRDDYKYPRKIPHVHYIARMKPRDHHGKAGNINNALYNTQAKGRYILLLDNDMRPHPKFLKATLPLFYCSPDVSSELDEEGRSSSAVSSFMRPSSQASSTHSMDAKPLAIPVTLPSVSPVFGRELNESQRRVQDIMTQEEQLRLKQTCDQQTEEIRELRRKIEAASKPTQYREYKTSHSRRQKKVFEGSAPTDLRGSRVSIINDEHDSAETETHEDPTTPTTEAAAEEE